MDFSRSIREWFKLNARDLPWRNTKDPYFIWLSEIILQQTRVMQGLPYYEKFTTTYPSLADLANADEQDILLHWQGLGYYSRARNLHTTAKIILEEHDGIFPNDYEQIKKLKGIGNYTAAAIASFAFDLPYPVIDGNVNRVIARYKGIDTAINSTAGEKIIQELATELFDAKHPAAHNQAIMELGALICTPVNPICHHCPVQKKCIAHSLNKQSIFPVKLKKVVVKKIHYSYFVIIYKNKIFIEKRSNGIWQQLHQFPLIERQIAPIHASEAIHEILDLSNEISPTLKQHFTDTHVLTHQRIFATFFIFSVNYFPKFKKNTIFEIRIDELGSKYPIPVLIKNFLNTVKL